MCAGSKTQVTPSVIEGCGRNANVPPRVGAPRPGQDTLKDVQNQRVCQVFGGGEGVVRRMVQARYPAPKPLSMLTTATPEAHELSMARSAARPWKDAP